MESTSKQLGRPMMLHAEVFENVFYYNEVKDDIQNNLEAQLAGTMYTPDTSQIRERLNSNIEDYARKNNIEIGTQQQTAIDGFLTQIEDNYKSSLGITFINYYVSVRKMFDNIYNEPIIFENKNKEPIAIYKIYEKDNKKIKPWKMLKKLLNC